jgi:hypothetical protein
LGVLHGAPRRSAMVAAALVSWARVRGSSALPFIGQGRGVWGCLSGEGRADRGRGMARGSGGRPRRRALRNIAPRGLCELRKRGFGGGTTRTVGARGKTRQLAGSGRGARPVLGAAHGQPGGGAGVQHGCRLGAGGRR